MTSPPKFEPMQLPCGVVGCEQLSCGYAEVTIKVVDAGGTTTPVGDTVTRVAAVCADHTRLGTPVHLVEQP